LKSIVNRKLEVIKVIISGVNNIIQSKIKTPSKGSHTLNSRFFVEYVCSKINEFSLSIQIVIILDPQNEINWFVILESGMHLDVVVLAVCHFW